MNVADKWEIAAMSDLVRVGRDEFGQDMLAEDFYLIAEHADGSRFAHFKSFRTVEYAGQNPEGFPVFHNVRADVIAKVEKFRQDVVSHLKRGGNLDASRWHEIDPAYGSEAYQRLDNVGYFKAREKMRDQF